LAGNARQTSVFLRRLGSEIEAEGRAGERDQRREDRLGEHIAGHLAKTNEEDDGRDRNGEQPEQAAREVGANHLTRLRIALDRLRLFGYVRINGFTDLFDRFRRFVVSVMMRRRALAAAITSRNG